MEFLIRRAILTDASDACQVVRRSIVELCLEDHRGDEPTIAAWIANKTVHNFQSWITSNKHVALVAESATTIVGFGLFNRHGHVSLLYVSPDTRFSGISKALLAGLEQEAVLEGIGQITLGSSGTARRFYLDSGYVSTGPPTQGFGITKSYPMSKRLIRGQRAN